MNDDGKDMLVESDEGLDTLDEAWSSSMLWLTWMNDDCKDMLAEWVILPLHKFTVMIVASKEATMLYKVYLVLEIINAK